jgi:hypothetical protein
LTYRLGARIAGAHAAAVGAGLFSVFYLQLFYSTRVMTEIPHLALCLLATELFLSGKRRRVLLSVPVIAVATLLRFPAALTLAVLVPYDALALRGRTLRSRPFLISLAIGGLIAVPYLIWAAATYGDPSHAWKASRYLMPALGPLARLEGLGFCFAWLWASLGWILCGLVLGGGVLLAIRSPTIASEASPAKPGLLLALWAGIPTAYFGLFVRPVQDRYLITAIPALFILTGHAIIAGGHLLARGRPKVGRAVSLAAAVAAAVFLLRDADTSIRSKVDSYSGLREAGRWLKENSEADARVMSLSVAQLTYYSERAGVPLAPGPEAAALFLREKGERYLVLSRYEGNPPWLQQLRSSGLHLLPLANFPPQKPEATVFRLSR